MHAEPESRRRSGLSGLIFAALALAVVGYLGAAGLQGEHGFFRLVQIEAEEARLRDDLAQLRVERAAVENKVRRLSTGSLDPDLLDERARSVLGLGREDEILIR